MSFPILNISKIGQVEKTIKNYFAIHQPKNLVPQNQQKINNQKIENTQSNFQKVLSEKYNFILSIPKKQKQEKEKDSLDFFLYIQPLNLKSKSNYSIYFTDLEKDLTLGPQFLDNKKVNEPLPKIRHGQKNDEIFKKIVLSFFHLNQFEYDFCLNFQIFMNKILRKFLKDNNLNFYSIGSPMNVLTQNKKGDCLYKEAEFKVFYPKDITSKSKEQLNLILNQKKPEIDNSQLQNQKAKKYFQFKFNQNTKNNLAQNKIKFLTQQKNNEIFSIYNKKSNILSKKNKINQKSILGPGPQILPLQFSHKNSIKKQELILKQLSQKNNQFLKRYNELQQIQKQLDSQEKNLEKKLNQNQINNVSDSQILRMKNLLEQTKFIQKKIQSRMNQVKSQGRENKQKMKQLMKFFESNKYNINKQVVLGKIKNRKNQFQQINQSQENLNKIETGQQIKQIIKKQDQNNENQKTNNLQNQCIKQENNKNNNLNESIVPNKNQNQHKIVEDIQNKEIKPQEHQTPKFQDQYFLKKVQKPFQQFQNKIENSDQVIFKKQEELSNLYNQKNQLLKKENQFLQQKNVVQLQQNQLEQFQDKLRHIFNLNQVSTNPTKPDQKQNSSEAIQNQQKIPNQKFDFQNNKKETNCVQEIRNIYNHPTIYNLPHTQAPQVPNQNLQANLFKNLNEKKQNQEILSINQQPITLFEKQNLQQNSKQLEENLKINKYETKNQTIQPIAFKNNENQQIKINTNIQNIGEQNNNNDQLSKPQKEKQVMKLDNTQKTHRESQIKMTTEKTNTPKEDQREEKNILEELNNFDSKNYLNQNQDILNFADELILTKNKKNKNQMQKNIQEKTSNNEKIGNNDARNFLLKNKRTVKEIQEDYDILINKILVREFKGKSLYNQNSSELNFLKINHQGNQVIQQNLSEQNKNLKNQNNEKQNLDFMERITFFRQFSDFLKDVKNFEKIAKDIQDLNIILELSDLAELKFTLKSKSKEKQEKQIKENLLKNYLLQNSYQMVQATKTQNIENESEEIQINIKIDYDQNDGTAVLRLGSEVDSSIFKDEEMKGYLRQALEMAKDEAKFNNVDSSQIDAILNDG